MSSSMPLASGFGRSGFSRELCFDDGNPEELAAEAAPTKSDSGRMHGPSRQRGYTLIEVIVAFALLALALTLLLGTLTGSTKQVRWSAEAGRAAIHAQSLLDRTGVGEALQPGRREGTFEGDDYRWTLDISPYVDPTPLSQPAQAGIDPGAPKLMLLVLAVRWGDGGAHQRLDLRSLRLVAPDMNQGGAFP